MAHAELDSDSTHITRRAGRTMSLRVMHDGGLKLNVPYVVSQRKLERFVNARLEWIKKRQSEFKTLYDFSPSSELADGLTVYVKESGELRTEAEEGAITIHKPKEVSDWQAYLVARADIKLQLNTIAQQLFPEEMNKLAAKHGFGFASLSIKFMRSRWGSCSPAKKIVLNSQLLRLPHTLRYYVMVHELAHLQAPNHSREFYDVLERMLPNAKRISKDLKKFRLLY